MHKLLPENSDITICQYNDLDSIKEKYEWVLCSYTETSVAFKADIKYIKQISNKVGARLFVDATGSIGLEENHEYVDLMAFSSCKGLFGLTGASFLAFKDDLEQYHSENFYFNINTHHNRMVTGPYHAMASLYGVIKNHNLYKERVLKSKNYIISKYKDIVRETNQPALYIS